MAPELGRDSFSNEVMPATNRLARLGNFALGLRQKRRLWAALAAAGCLLTSTLASTANGEDSATKLAATGLIGISANDILTANSEDANEAASQIAQLGATAVRVFYSVNKDSAWDTYKQEICNAAQAAQSHGLQLIVAFEGVNHGLGYYPRTNTEMHQFIRTVDSVLWDLGSKNGCTPDVKTYRLEINEENNPTFNKNLLDPSYNGPQQTALFDYKLSSVLNADAAKPEINATVIYADSLAEGSHDSVSFLEQQGEALLDHNLPNPYKEVDVHPYPDNPTADPTATIARLIAKDNQIITTYFPGSQLTLGEYGINTNRLPASISNSYSPATSQIGVSERQQALYDTEFLNATKNLPWRTLFDYKDHGGGSMPSAGVEYINGEPKTSYLAVQSAIEQQTDR